MKILSDETYKKYKDILHSRVIDNSIKWGQGILMDKSPAGWTVDLRETILEPYYADIISSLFMKWISLYRPDYVAGMTVAAGCLVSQIVLKSHLCKIPVKGLYIRRNAKKDGMQRQIEGPLKEGGRVLLVDDLLHSAEIAALQSIDILTKHKCIPVALSVILDFDRSGRKDLEKLGIPVHHIFTLHDLNMTPSLCENNSLYALSWRGGPVNSGRYYAPKSGPVAGGKRIFLGSDRGRFLSLLSDGRPDWFFSVGETYRGIQTTPLYRKGRVYFGAYDGWTYCLKGSNGRVIWKEKWGDWVGCSSPVYSPGKDIFFVGIEYGQAGGDMCAFSGEDGLLYWRFKTKDYITCAPGLHEPSSTVFAGSLDNSLYALNMADGKEKWRFTTGGHIKGGITADKRACYFTSYDGYLYCLNIETGRVLWKRKLGRWLYSRPAVNKDVIVVTTEADYVFCLNKYSGKILWKRCLSDKWRMSAYPVIKYGRVYVGSAGGAIFVLSLKDGKPLWMFQTGAPVMAPVGVFSPSELPVNNLHFKGSNLKKNSFARVKDMLFYPGEAGLTHVFNEDRTELLWSYQHFSSNPLSPYSNVMIASSNDGYLYCFLETLKF